MRRTDITPGHPCASQLPRLLLVAGAASLAAAAPPIRYSTIAASGDPAPGLPGVTFARVLDPRLDAIAGVGAGTIAFQVRLEGPGVSEANNTAVYVQRDSSLFMFAREGDLTPSGDFPLSQISGLVVRSDGRVMFTAPVIEAPGSNPVRLALFAENPAGEREELARETSLTPEIYPQPAWSESGIIAQSMSRKLTRGSQITLAGDPAPGFASGILFKRFSQQPSVNAAGRTSFHATVGSNDTEVSWISVIYSDAGGSLAPVAFTGQSAPGTGGVFAELGREPAIDAASATFFWARVANMPASTQGIWRAHAATLAPMLLTGQTITAAPGPIASIARQIGLSASGAFTAVVSFAASQGPVPAIVEVTPTGDARIIAMRGMQAPDAPPGVHYQVLGPSFISAEGQIAFHSILAGEGVEAGSQEAIYAVSPSGIPRLVARTGVSMEVDGLGSVTPIQLSFGSGGSFGGSVQFSGNATLAFRAIFASAGPGQNEALILAEIPCTADQDGSGFVDTDDFTYFVGLFEAGDPRADIDGSGFVDTDDFTAFVIAFEAGC